MSAFTNAKARARQRICGFAIASSIISDQVKKNSHAHILTEAKIYSKFPQQNMVLIKYSSS
jgi:hypothetical protein